MLMARESAGMLIFILFPELTYNMQSSIFILLRKMLSAFAFPFPFLFTSSEEVTGMLS